MFKFVSFAIPWLIQLLIINFVWSLMDFFVLLRLQCSNCNYLQSVTLPWLAVRSSSNKRWHIPPNRLENNKHKPVERSHTPLWPTLHIYTQTHTVIVKENVWYKKKSKSKFFRAPSHLFIAAISLFRRPLSRSPIKTRVFFL